MTRFFFDNSLVWLCQASAFLLIYSGIVHLSNPYLFFESVLKYEVVPEVIAQAIAMMLPSAQLVCGICLFFRPDRVSKIVAMVFFGSFAFVQWSAILRGLEISCGCFGAQGGKITFTSAALVSVVAILLLFSIIAPLGKNRSALPGC